MPLRFPLLTAALLVSAGASAQIEADRPGFAFSSSTVGAGVFQVEAGLPEAQFLGSGGEAYSVPVAVRYGLTPGVEVRAETSVFDAVRSDGDTDADVGFSVLTLGAKVAVPVSGFSLALIPELLVPIEGGQDVAFQLNVPASFDVGAFEWTLSPGVVTGDGSTTLNAVASVSRAFGTLAPYVEIAAFPGLDDAGGTPVLAGAGLTALLSQDVQVDAFFNVGLNDDAPDAGVGIGISYRFD